MGYGCDCRDQRRLVDVEFKIFRYGFFDIVPENSRSIAAVTKLGAIFSHDASGDKAVYPLAKSTWNEKIKYSRKTGG